MSIEYSRYYILNRNIQELLNSGRIDYLIFSTEHTLTINRTITVPVDEVWLLWNLNLRVIRGVTDTFSSVVVGITRQETNAVALIYFDTPTDSSAYINYPSNYSSTVNKTYINAYPLILFPRDTISCTASITASGYILMQGCLIIQRINVKDFIARGGL